MFTIYECVIEIENNGNIQRHVIQAPRIMIEQEFMSLIQQAVNSPSPISIKVMRNVPIYDNFDNKWVEREYSVKFMNRAYEKNMNTNQ